MSIEPSGIGGEWRDGCHRLPVRIYYEDTDFSGVVYHASYLRFLERGRTESLRALGIHNSALYARAPAEALAFAVRRMAIDFVKPARMDDLVVVETRVGKMTGAVLHLLQRVVREGDVLVRADVQVVAIGSGRPRRLPADVREKLAPFAADSSTDAAD